MTIKTTFLYIRIIASIVTMIALFFVAGFIFRPEVFKEKLDTEVFKLTYQFLLITVIGGALSFLFTFYIKLREETLKDREKESANIKEEKNLQRKFYYEFIQAYNDAKKVRRFLRARGRILSANEPNSTKILIKTSRYDELMKELTSIQLKFEFFCEEIKANPKLFGNEEDTEVLLSIIPHIEDYLNELVGEYEKCYESYPGKSFIDEIPEIPLKELPRLKEFIIQYKSATDFKLFKASTKSASRIILKILTTDGNPVIDPTPNAPHFVARLNYLTSKEGGRTTAAHSGHRPIIKFEGRKHLTSGQQVFIGTDKVNRGESVDAEIIIIETDIFKNYLYPGLKFHFTEGKRIIGTGEVREVLDKSLEKVEENSKGTRVRHNEN